MHFIIKGLHICCDGHEIEELIADNYGYYHASFEFDADWDNVAKTARFICGDDHRDSLIGPDNTCLIPGEVLHCPGLLKVCVFAGDVLKPAIITDSACLRVTKSILTDSNYGLPDDPDPNIYTQIVNTAADALKIAKSVEERANAGEFNGRDGVGGGGNIIVDQNYNSQSANAQSGMAVADALDNKKMLRHTSDTAITIVSVSETQADMSYTDSRHPNSKTVVLRTTKDGIVAGVHYDAGDDEPAPFYGIYTPDNADGHQAANVSYVNNKISDLNDKVNKLNSAYVKREVLADEAYLLEGYYRSARTIFMVPKTDSDGNTYYDEYIGVTVSKEYSSFGLSVDAFAGGDEYTTEYFDLHVTTCELMESAAGDMCFVTLENEYYSQQISFYFNVNDYMTAYDLFSSANMHTDEDNIKWYDYTFYINVQCNSDGAAVLYNIVPTSHSRNAELIGNTKCDLSGYATTADVNAVQTYVDDKFQNKQDRFGDSSVEEFETSLVFYIHDPDTLYLTRCQLTFDAKELRYNRNDNGKILPLCTGTPTTDRHATPKSYVDNAIGSIETALDSIIAIQEQLIGGVV